MKKENEKDYEREILVRLVKKYYKRQVTYGQIKNERRILLKVTEIYKDYEKTNCDLHLKLQVNDAAMKLEKLQFITVEHLLYSDDIVKVFLKKEQLYDIEDYLEKQYHISTREYLVHSIKQLIKDYRNKGNLPRFYCEKLEHSIQSSVNGPDVVKEREILQMLEFLQNNKRELYVREASMLVYGSSKYFEETRYESVCNVIRDLSQGMEQKSAFSDEVLHKYHVINVEQEICIKGDYVIEFPDYILKTKYLTGGISLSSKDILRIKRMEVRTENIMTIENKTAFCRFGNTDYSTLYLGGFANRHQISFLEKLYLHNPDHTYYHFGDIDVGGFLIHQNLCNAAGIEFRLYRMGVEELRNVRYRHCLQKLTENDRERMKGLIDHPLYHEVLAEMIKDGIKLEQEIVCSDIMDDESSILSRCRQLDRQQKSVDKKQK